MKITLDEFFAKLDKPTTPTAKEKAMKSLIRDYYMTAFPSDNMGDELNPFATFLGLWETLCNGGDVYEFMWAGDSVIRERLFSKLANIMNVPYDYIYDAWVRA